MRVGSNELPGRLVPPFASTREESLVYGQL